MFLFLIFCGSAIGESSNREAELNQLFDQLKKNKDSTIAFEIEMKIWNIWSIHPTQEKLTDSLAIGSDLMSKGELEEAYEIFSKIIESLRHTWKI